MKLADLLGRYFIHKIGCRDSAWRIRKIKPRYENNPDCKSKATRHTHCDAIKASKPPSPLCLFQSHPHQQIIQRRARRVAGQFRQRAGVVDGLQFAAQTLVFGFLNRLVLPAQWHKQWSG